MAVELGEIAAGLPFAASIAMTTGIGVLREGRRRTSLNEAMHELRRPLQALALSLPREADASCSALQMAAGAVDRLEHEINGRPLEPVAERVSVRPMVEAALARWRPRAVASGRSLELRWNAAEPALWGYPEELARAVDNLISNGFEHGEGAVDVAVLESSGRLRIEVRDRGAGRAGPRPLSLGRRRHGHGLRIVRRTAARHGGSFRLRPAAVGTEATLELPLAGGAR